LNKLMNNKTLKKNIHNRKKIDNYLIYN